MAEQRIDYDESVVLLVQGEPRRAMRLADAIQAVVMMDPVLRRAACITRAGPPLMHFNEIEAIYNRLDFPRSKACIGLTPGAPSEGDPSVG